MTLPEISLLWEMNLSNQMNMIPKPVTLFGPKFDKESQTKNEKKVDVKKIKKVENIENANAKIENPEVFENPKENYWKLRFRPRLGSKSIENPPKKNETSTKASTNTPKHNIRNPSCCNTYQICIYIYIYIYI